MKTALMIHSKTGHTLEVAQRLMEALSREGHQVELIPVRAANDSETKVEAIRLDSLPDMAPFELIVIGGPVRGGRLSPVMQAAIRQLPALSNVRLLGFVTQAFPSPSMGGIQAMRCLEEICASKDGHLSRTAIVNWMFPKKRESQIARLIEDFTGLFA